MVVSRGMRRFELVIFDNDGVVVDSEALSSQAMSETLAGAGFPVTPEQCDQWFKGGTLAHTRQFVEQRFGTALPPDFEDSYTGTLFTRFAAHLRPVPGIEAVLDRLDAAGMPYCLASSGRRQRVLFALETTGLADRFTGRWWGADDVINGKPAPDLFLLAARTMKFDPVNCVVVEDAEVGVTAARAAGMAVLGFAARTPRQSLAAADVVFTDMAELPGLVLAGLPLDSTGSPLAV
jgi:HAD superfamily hydrolase (TIGR01509 family)